MEQTILLEETASNKRQKILYLICGLFFCANGVVQFMSENPGSLKIVLAISMLACGAAYIFMAQNGFAKMTRAPKCRLTDDFLELKPTFFSGTTRIYWKDIRSIELASYKFIVKLTNAEKTLNYQTSANISKELKGAIRSIAQQKNIEVID